jgi:pimeloyl-ACP methyl ester carboxylesterase
LIIMPDEEAARSPLMLLEPLAVSEVEITPALHHVEVYTLTGLLTLLWHGPRDTARVVITAGGGMGSLLGPADGIYHYLGAHFARDDIATIRVGYRRPNHLPYCVHDLAAAADLAVQGGAKSVVTVGHSFGGAVAINTGIALGRHAAGVVTLATQSAGCEHADLLACPLLLVHGEGDELLPPMASEMVRMIVGHGELHLLPETGHLLKEADSFLRERLGSWIPERFAIHPGGEYGSRFRDGIGPS